MKNYSSEFFKQHQNTTYTNRKRTLESNYGISPFDITPYNNNLSLFQNQSENLSEMVRTRVNKEEIINEFDPKNCSLEEDWHEWFKSSFNQLFFNSPSYVLSCCRHLSEYLTDLYNYDMGKYWVLGTPEPTIINSFTKKRHNITKYINIGSMLLNIKKLKQNKFWLKYTKNINLKLRG